MRIPLGRAEHNRSVAQTPHIALYNRYFEADPTNQEDQVALLCRPALRKWKTVGSGPIRGVYSCPGTFDEALFVVSGTDLHRIAVDETDTNVGNIGADSAVSFAATDDPFLFLCDGGILWLYAEDGLASGTLTGTAANNDTITVGSIVYKWTNGSVDTGTPAGTLANPWLVALGASNTIALSNMSAAINDTGTAGTTYSTALTAHTDVTATSSSSTTLVVRAIATGSAGNAIATTETGAALAWGGATLSGGGSASLTQVPVPDNLSITSVAYIASFVICTVAPDQGFNGRFFWIEPFETTIDPLNFATAESQPDASWEAITVGDQVWFPGQSSIEVWYPTGDELIPFLRQQGRVLPRGIWPGTIRQVKDAVMLVGNDGIVYAVGPDGGARPVSTPGITQRIREAINAARSV